MPDLHVNEANGREARGERPGSPASQHSPLAPACTCDPPEAYPFHCPCLDLDILGPEMHTICRAEPLLINGQPRDYDRDTMLAAWRRGQTSSLKQRPSIRSVIRGAVGVAKAFAEVATADRPTAESRYKVCLRCADNDLGQCRVCGCFVAVKVRNRSERCPSGRW